MALPKINSPKYEMVLPSTNDRIQFRPYLVKEEKILMMAMESNDTNQMVRAIKEVISACTEGAVEVDQMTMFDLEYAFVQLRSKSVGESTTIGVKCESCEVKNDVEVDLSEVSVDIDPDSDKSSIIKLTDSIGVKMKYPSVDSVMEAQNSAPQNGTAVSEVQNVFNLLIRCIDSIYSDDEIFDASEQTHAELLEFIESLNTEQFGRIREFIEGMPSASLNVDFKCVNCGTQNNFDVQGIANFFG